jgi:hypothetical protein
MLESSTRGVSRACGGDVDDHRARRDRSRSWFFVRARLWSAELHYDGEHSRPARLTIKPSRRDTTDPSDAHISCEAERGCRAIKVTNDARSMDIGEGQPRPEHRDDRPLTATTDDSVRWSRSRRLGSRLVTSRGRGMGHIGAYALERIGESKALARASARRAEKQAHRRIAGGTRVSW